MPIVNICDGCGKRIEKSILLNQILGFRKQGMAVFCDSCMQVLEDFAIRRFNLSKEIQSDEKR